MSQNAGEHLIRNLSVGISETSRSALFALGSVPLHFCIKAARICGMVTRLFVDFNLCHLLFHWLKNDGYPFEQPANHTIETLGSGELQQGLRVRTGAHPLPANQALPTTCPRQPSLVTHLQARHPGYHLSLLLPRWLKTLASMMPMAMYPMEKISSIRITYPGPCHCG